MRGGGKGSGSTRDTGTAAWAMASLTCLFGGERERHTGAALRERGRGGGEGGQETSISNIAEAMS